ncbi:MAG TPA: patatin-like phospholipase family protein [Solirubrobacteraceae bacterium]|jgi:NTE family protein|nr:patatin-like phospholipase family protein [Solirubrobacteraceae bacterium]
MLSRPDILVLGGGGVLGEAWINGVLAGIEDATDFDLRRCEYFVGTSAGSIVAAQLVAGQSPERPAPTGAALVARTESAPASAGGAVELAKRAGSWALALGSPLAPMALGITAPGGALVRAAMLRTVPRPRGTLSRLREQIDRSGTKFDGRLRVVTVERRSGRRVVFGRPGAPRASVGQAVAASCTVPWLFEPVRIGDREYVDGGIWSPTNLDVAPAWRDTQVLCLNPLAGTGATHSLFDFARSVARSSVSLEELSLRRRGAAVQTVSPDLGTAAAMGQNLMDREPRARVLAAGYQQGRRLAMAR